MAAQPLPEEPGRQTEPTAQPGAPVAVGPAFPDQAILTLPQGQRKQWIEGFAAPGGLRPLMQAMGDQSGFSDTGDWYHTEIFPLFMGVCGDAFRFVWYRQDGTRPEPADRYAAFPPAQQYLPALEAAGFVGRVVCGPRLTGKADPGWNADGIRREVIASIAQRKWPVLLIDAPKPGWTSLIVGYEGSGARLIGWCEEGWESFGFKFEPAKRQTFDDWFANAGGVVLLASRHERPAEADVLRAALQRAVPELTRRSAGNILAGPATYEALAKKLDDVTLSGTDPETAKRRDALLFPMIWDLATQRHYASIFLHRAAEVFPSAADRLEAASEAFRKIHDAVWEINRLGGGKDPGSPLPTLADPDVRAQAIRVILQCRDRDLEAAAQIEAALAKTP